MKPDFQEIGRRIKKRRKELGLTQAKVCERADINDKYLSRIEGAYSIPSLEVVLKLAEALETTPDCFLVGSVRHEDDSWRDAAEALRGMDEKQLKLAKSLLKWIGDQEL